MANIIGIDLGTTMSAIAKLNDLGTPEIIPNSDGERIMPSVVNFVDRQTILVGEEAKNSAADEPNRVAKEFKRKMDDLEYRFIIKEDNLSFSAIELSSFILKKLVKDASEKIGEIKDVVITVPAYFKDIQRHATKQAGELAGLNVISIINEPTAAALYYAKESNINGKGLVYDLGGGTFDITITDTNGNNIEIISSNGDAHLGGVDFDKVILNLMKEKYRTITNGELCPDEDTEMEFSLMAEDIKISLSKKDIVKKKLRGPAGSAVIEISRAEFEDSVSSLLYRTEMLIETLLDEVNMSPNDIDYVLLVGGSTRIPIIRESIKKIFNKEPLNAVNVDEIVALGAAIKAGLTIKTQTPALLTPSIQSGLSDLVVQEVANHSYGVVQVGEREELVNTIVIPKNTPLPCQKEAFGYLMYDGQEYVNVEITQGEGEEVEWVDVITKIELHTPNGKKGDEIKHIYSYDENQIMHCKSIHLKTGSSVESKINLGDNFNSNKTGNNVALEEFLIS